MQPNTFLSELVQSIYRGKKQPFGNLGYVCHYVKTAQSKKSPNRRKTAQSGHPDHDTMSHSLGLLSRLWGDPA
jgi:hypothetical protein